MYTCLSKKVYAACAFPTISDACSDLLELSSHAVGPHNIYDIYDNCPRTSAYLASMGNKTMRWLLKKLRDRMNTGVDLNTGLLGGGYEWSCGDTYPPGAVSPWFARKDVQAALHLNAPGQSKFHYKTSGPASITLYPYLIKHMRVLIYNGDADSCVPYKGNEEWVRALFCFSGFFGPVPFFWLVFLPRGCTRDLCRFLRSRGSRGVPLPEHVAEVCPFLSTPSVFT